MKKVCSSHRKGDVFLEHRGCDSEDAALIIVSFLIFIVFVTYLCIVDAMRDAMRLEIILVYQKTTKPCGFDSVYLDSQL